MEKALTILLGFLMALCIAVVIALLLGFPVMWLWNYVMVDFGLPAITFWKSLALTMLVKMLVSTNYNKD